jgi:hypothetical protein
MPEGGGGGGRVSANEYGCIPYLFVYLKRNCQWPRWGLSGSVSVRCLSLPPSCTPSLSPSRLERPLLLNIPTFLAFFTSLGIWFQLSTTLLEKKFLHTSNLAGLGLRLSGPSVLLLPFLPGLRIRIHFIRFRIQHFRMNTNPDPIRIQGFNDQKLEEKKLNFFLIKNCNLPIPKPP